MPTREEIFKQHFTAIVRGTRTPADDPEGFWMIGSLAARIIDEARRPSWAAFKASLTAQSFDALLKTFQTQGNALAKQGASRQVRAIEVLGLSLVAKTQTADPEVVAGNALLDRMIDDAIAVFRDNQTVDPIIS